MDFEAELKKKYDYFSINEISKIVKRAKSIMVEQMYPADLSVNYTNFDWTNPRYEMWILDCCDELIEREGLSSLISYRENGISKDFGRAVVSQAMLDRIPRMAKAIDMFIPTPKGQ